MNETNLKLTIGGITGLASYMVGSINYLWVILAIMAIFDFVTGVTASVLNEETFDKKKCIRGGIIKLFYFVLILVAVMCDYMAIDLKIPFAENKLMSLVANVYFIGAEGLSLLGNLSKIGVPIPSILKSFFEKINGDNK